jgi:hypothetical protein
MFSSTVDVPIWTVGDSWTYNEKYEEISYDKNGDIAYHWVRNCSTTYTVTADTGDRYILTVSSNNLEGGFKYGLLRVEFTPSLKFIEELECRKSDLGYVNSFHSEKGLAFLSLGDIELSIPTYYSQIWNASFIPAYVILPFPFTVGEQGIIPSCTETGHEKWGLYWGLIKFLDSDFCIEYAAQHYGCEMAHITLSTDEYYAYNISINEQSGSLGNFSWLYYVPELGYYVKWVEHYNASANLPIKNFTCELVSTTCKP